MKLNYLWPRLLLLGAALMWGGGFIGVQDALDHGWSVNYILAIRGLLGGGILLAVQWKTHWWKKKYLLRSGISLGILLFIGFALQTIGQELSTPSNSAFLTALYIMLVPVIMKFYKKRAIGWDAGVAMVLATVGVGVLSLTADLSLHIGDVMLLVGAVAFALQIVLLEEIALAHEPIALAGIQLTTMGVLGSMLIPFSAPVQPTGGYYGLLYISLFSSCLAFLIQAACQRLVPPSTTSLLLGAESVLGSLLSVMLGYELLSGRLLVGGSFFVIAIIVCEAKPLSKWMNRKNESVIEESA